MISARYYRPVLFINLLETADSFTETVFRHRLARNDYEDS